MNLNDVLGIDLDNFNKNYRGKQFFRGRVQDPDVLEILSWDQLNGLLDTSDRRLDTISLVKEDARLDRRAFIKDANIAERSRLLPAAVRRAMIDGYSLTMTQIQGYHGAARNLCELLTNCLGEYVGINVYASWITEKCFLTHWDEHDVFIIQTEGEKLWTIYRETRRNPVADDIDYATDKENLELEWEGTITKGDVLYIPRGWWHHAQSTGNGSLHMTAGFRNQTGLDFFDFLSNRAAMVTDFRADLPRPFEDGVSEEWRDKFKSEVLQFLESEFGSGLIDKFWKDRFSVLPARRRNSLPVLLNEEHFRDTDPMIQLAGLAPFVIHTERENAFEVEIGGKRWTLDTRAREVVNALSTGRQFRVSTLAKEVDSDLSAEEIEALCFELVNDGFLNVVSPSSELEVERIAAQ